MSEHVPIDGSILRSLICAQYVQENGKVEAITRASDISECCIRECESSLQGTVQQERWRLGEAVAFKKKIKACDYYGIDTSSD